MTTTLDTMDLSNMRTMRGVLANTPSGEDAVAMAKALGLWTSAAHDEPGERPQFKRNLSELGPGQLSDQYALWTAEFGRITELCGMLVGQREIAKLKAKAARAAARARKRREYAGQEGVKMPAATVINDEIEEDVSVQTADEVLARVEIALVQAQATKEATAQYIATLSREIGFKGEQMRGKIY